MTGSPEDMKRIQAEGKLDEWCNDNLKWLRDTFGKENVVSAVLHMDETTPHIHATLIPILTGERRKAKTEQPDGKRKYKKKDTTGNRLCADDVMTRVNLKAYQDTYAQSMQAYGLKRGIDGSEAKHITNSQYYRDLLNQSESIQADIKNLTEQREQAEKELSRIKGDIKTGELKNAVVSTTTKAVKRFNSLFDNKEITQKEQEIKALTNENNDLKKEISQLNNHIQKMEKDHKEETDKLNETLDKIYYLFPIIKEWLKIEELCRFIGFGKDMIKELTHRKPITFSGSLRSPEFNRHFNTENSTAKVEHAPEERGKLRLMIDGISDSEWFRNKRKEFLQMVGVKPKQTSKEEHGKRKGMKF
ncbi:MobV family relaxase [Culturomica massiliensis]|uniref:MobV family relaxase n=1 Tax=Culturomica massiliensis TaxID=1841857 RepID=UPI003AEF9BBB